MIAMFDDDVDPPKKILDLPEWVEWDDQIPALHVKAPANLSNINPVYEFRVMAMVDDDKEEMAEEKLIVVVAHSCFNKCPKHFGVGCEDWDLWMKTMGVFGMIFFVWGCVGHCIVATAYEWVMNRKRKRRVDDDRVARRIEYARLLKHDPDSVADDEENHWFDDYDDIWRPNGRPKRFDCCESMRWACWIFWINCCCFKDLTRVV